MTTWQHLAATQDKTPEDDLSTSTQTMNFQNDDDILDRDQEMLALRQRLETLRSNPPQPLFAKEHVQDEIDTAACLKTFEQEIEDETKAENLTPAKRTWDRDENDPENKIRTKNKVHFKDN